MELQVQDLVCQRCHHIIRAEPQVIERYKKEFEAGSRKCEICYNEKGIFTGMTKLTQCSGCSQVWRDNQEFLCFCKPKNGIKIVYPQMKGNKGAIKKENDNAIEDQEAFSILKKRVRDAEREPFLRQERMEKTLQNIEKLLEEIIVSKKTAV